MNEAAAGEATSPPSRRDRRHRLLVIAWLGYWLLLTGLLLAPKVPRAPITISPKGLVIHFWTFACLAGATVLVRHSKGARCTLVWAIAWTAVYATYGGLAELLQPLTGRQCDIEDFFANTLGAVVVLLLAVLRDRRTTATLPA